MTDIKHDPELPHAVLSEDGAIRARFASRVSAERWKSDQHPEGQVIDTTPVPPYESGSVLFRPSHLWPLIRRLSGQWWYANGAGDYVETAASLTDADVREGVKTKGWKVFYQGEPVE